CQLARGKLRFRFLRLPAFVDLRTMRGNEPLKGASRAGLESDHEFSLQVGDIDNALELTGILTTRCAVAETHLMSRVYQVKHSLVVLESGEAARQLEIASSGREEMTAPCEMVIRLNFNGLGESIFARQIADIRPFVEVECFAVLRDGGPERRDKNITLSPHRRVLDRKSVV